MYVGINITFLFVFYLLLFIIYDIIIMYMIKQLYMFTVYHLTMKVTIIY